jgi:hypothetical protein
LPSCGITLAPRTSFAARILVCLINRQAHEIGRMNFNCL